MICSHAERCARYGKARAACRITRLIFRDGISGREADALRSARAPIGVASTWAAQQRAGLRLRRLPRCGGAVLKTPHWRARCAGRREPHSVSPIVSLPKHVSACMHLSTSLLVHLSTSLLVPEHVPAHLSTSLLVLHAPEHVPA